MKFCSLLFLSSMIGALSILTSCEHPLNKFPAAQPQNLHYDTSLIAIIPLDSTFSKPFDKRYKEATLTERDLDKIERMLKITIDRYNAALKSADREWYEINLQKYKYRRQYVCAINRDGEKEVFVNCFCTSMDYWRKHLVVVSDGGKCFFSLKINLSTSESYEFTMNGYA